MTSASKDLQVGDRVTTDFSGKVTHHEITERETTVFCSSGVAFKVRPTIPKSGGPGSWLDSRWFKPETTAKEIPS